MSAISSQNPIGIYPIAILYKCEKTHLYVKIFITVFATPQIENNLNIHQSEAVK